MSTKLTLREASKSFNGWDFIAVKKATGSPLTELDDEITVYAVYFIAVNRVRKEEGTAPMTWDEALSTPMTEITDYFAPEPKADAVPLEETQTS